MWFLATPTHYGGVLKVIALMYHDVSAAGSFVVVKMFSSLLLVYFAHGVVDKQEITTNNKHDAWLMDMDGMAIFQAVADIITTQCIINSNDDDGWYGCHDMADFDQYRMIAGEFMAGGRIDSNSHGSQ